MPASSATYRRILVPVDGSDASKLGLREALRLAGQAGAKMCLLHVVDASIVNMSMDAVMDASRFLELVRRDGEKILEDSSVVAARRGIKAQTKLAEAIEQRPAEVIVDEARRWRADLIVMGTHGRRGFNRMFLGSTAEGVLRTAGAPVLLLRAIPKAAKQRRKPSRPT